MAEAATKTAQRRDVAAAVAADVTIKEGQARAAIALLDDGSTVPFVARYRKEATGGLDDAQLRLLEERLRYRRELEDRRDAVLRSVDEQGKLTDELKLKFLQADSKADLEDLYLALQAEAAHQGANRQGSGSRTAWPRALLADPMKDPTALAAAYVDARTRAIDDQSKALDGARQILMERFAETPEVAKTVRGRMAARRRSDLKGRAGQGEGRREVRRLFRPPRTAWQRAAASRLGVVPRAQSGGFVAGSSIARRAGYRRSARLPAASGDDCGDRRRDGSGPRRRRLDARDRALDVESENGFPHRRRTLRQCLRAVRGRVDPRVRRELARFVAGGAGGPEGGAGARSGLSYGL